jgi:2,5-diamino-6-(ribosylamino)-4(3H)-pyrimidinone 5'-phosphate reductase
MRPYLIVHTIASADGRVSLGPRRTGFEDMADERWLAMWASHSRLEESIHGLAEQYRPNAFLEGSGSFVAEDDGAARLPVEEVPGSNPPDFLPSVVVDAPERAGWFVVVDSKGRLRSGIKEFEGWPGWHTLHLVSRSAPDEYLAFLRRTGIPYLVAGAGQVDLPEVFSKMGMILGIDRIVCTAGSRLNGALLRAGLVDEVSLVLLPALIGGTDTPTLFRSPELGEAEWPTRLELLSVRGEPLGRVCVRYRVTRAESV